MKIISKFRDYYDGVQIYGADPDLRYIRKTVELKPNDAKDLMAFFKSHACIGHDYRFTSEYYYLPVLIFFCGKMYPVLEVGMRYGEDAVYAYTLKDAIAFFTERKIGVPASFYKDDWQSKIFFSPYTFMTPPLDIGPDLFVAHASPIMVARQNPRFSDPTEFILNPCLRDYGFAKIIDPNTAYQELSMFLGSVLTNTGKPMVAVDEKKRIEKRGFDKWSFRKPPTKRKIK